VKVEFVEDVGIESVRCQEWFESIMIGKGGSGNIVGVTKRQWFSGKIQRCHRWAPGSIPGWRRKVITLHVVVAERSKALR
jgi:hypothetical protein